MDAPSIALPHIAEHCCSPSHTGSLWTCDGSRSGLPGCCAQAERRMKESANTCLCIEPPCSVSKTLPSPCQHQNPAPAQQKQKGRPKAPSPCVYGPNHDQPRQTESQLARPDPSPPDLSKSDHAVPVGGCRHRNAPSLKGHYAVFSPCRAKPCHSTAKLASPHPTLPNRTLPSKPDLTLSCRAIGACAPHNAPSGYAVRCEAQVRAFVVIPRKAENFASWSRLSRRCSSVNSVIRRCRSFCPVLRKTLRTLRPSSSIATPVCS